LIVLKLLYETSFVEVSNGVREECACIIVTSTHTHTHTHTHTYRRPGASVVFRSVSVCSGGWKRDVERAGGEGAYLTWCLLWFIFLTNTRHNAHNNDCGGYTLLKSFYPPLGTPKNPSFQGFFSRSSRVKVLRRRVLYACGGVATEESARVLYIL
jgi:hypothetical protein